MIFLLIPYLLLELYLSLKVGESIGFVGSAIWIILTMIIGVRLLQNSSFTLMGNFSSVAQGKLSMKAFQNAATYYMLGAILLIIPGVLSDFLGILALIYTFYLQFTAKIQPEQTFDPFSKRGKHTQGENDVIDVEIVDKYTDNDLSGAIKH